MGTLSGASTIFGHVRIVSLAGHLMDLGVIEGVVHETAIAALVTLAGGAVDELLLGERVELRSRVEVGTLHCSCGRESPAGSALALVLNIGDGTLISPVDSIISHMSSMF